jgi:hypothetical protein
MTTGFRVRNDQGLTRLEYTDYTVRIVFSSVFIVNGDGSQVVPGISAANAGAFLVPCWQAGYPSTGGVAMASIIGQMCRVIVGTDIVTWNLASGQLLGKYWNLVVVRYL